jgi:hypothetical protein
MEIGKLLLGGLGGPVGVLQGSFRGPIGRKTEKLDFQAFFFVAPIGDSGRFDVTGWSGNTLRIELDPVLPPFCPTE